RGIENGSLIFREMLFLHNYTDSTGNLNSCETDIPRWLNIRLRRQAATVKVRMLIKIPGNRAFNISTIGTATFGLWMRKGKQPDG
ncbi:hypothetical protein O3V59_15280, partial [Brevibacillus thermoruber]